MTKPDSDVFPDEILVYQFAHLARTWTEFRTNDVTGCKYVRADLVDRADHIGDVNKMVSENDDLAKDLAEYTPLPLAGIQRLIEAIEMCGYTVTKDAP